MPSLQAKNASATKIQALTRGFFARRHYTLSSIPFEHRLSSPLFVKGSDPKINDLPRQPSDKKIIIIGTSGLRTVELACKLGGVLPKILLVDNSRAVIDFWHTIRAFAARSLNQNDLFGRLRESDLTEKRAADTIDYLTELCGEFGFERVKSLIVRASVIAQNWEDKKTFKALANLITLQQYDGVYVYPSNIAAFLWATNKVQKAKDVLQNIALLNPDIAIHTDLSIHGGPMNVVQIKKDQHSVNDVLAKLDIHAITTPTLMRTLMPVLMIGGIGLLLFYWKAMNALLKNQDDDLNSHDSMVSGL